jgi:hypothetical protein
MLIFGSSTFALTTLRISIKRHNTQHYETACVLSCCASFTMSVAFFIVVPSVSMLNVVMLNVVMLNVVMLNVVMLNVIMLNVIMLSAVMLNVIMLMPLS